MVSFCDMNESIIHLYLDQPLKVKVNLNLSEGFYIESSRLKTAPLCDKDAFRLFQIYSDGDAMKYRGSGPMNEIEDAQKMISRAFITDDSVSKLRLGIKTKVDGELIGTLLLSVREDGHCEIGFSFEKEHWGKGYGQEILKTTEEKLRNFENTRTIRAWCIKENVASNRLFEKAGFSLIEQNKYPQSNLFEKKV